MSAVVRSALSDTELEKALEGCADEPIHIPGSIQSHGVLFVLSLPDLIVRQLSANTEAFFGRSPEDLLERPIDELLGEERAKDLETLATVGDPQPPKASSIVIDTHRGAARFDAIVHRSEGHLLLELEPSPQDNEVEEVEQLFGQLREVTMRFRGADRVEDLNRLVVEEIRRLTGFDRVMLYQFDEEWNGDVKAEAQSGDLVSYLGLHFPASDIPSQARKLYTKSSLRLIVDVDADVVPITPAKNPFSKKLTDLSYAVLRSVSPVHIQYLQNMDVRATMTISIMQKRKLWGLVACHHMQPKSLPYRRRLAAELAAQIFSAQLAALLGYESSDQQKRHKSQMAQIGADLAPEKTLQGSLRDNSDRFRDLLSADSLVCRIDGELICFGEPPPGSALQDIVSWLDRQDTSEPVATSMLGEEIDLSEEALALACGLLSVPLNNDTQDLLLWFRKEISRQVNWAGKPEKQIAEEGGRIRLTPRGSFALWKETVGGAAPEWSVNDRQIAEQIGQLVQEKKVKDRLRQHEADLEMIMANSSAPIYTKDRGGHFVFANKSMCALLGMAPEEVVGKTDLDLFPSQTAHNIRSSDQQVFKDGKSVTVEEILPSADQDHHMLTVKFPLLGPEGAIHAICSIATDIGEQKYAEVLKRSNEELEDFASIASHDLREPLRGIQSIAAFLLRDYGAGIPLDEEGKQRLRRLMDLSKRMTQLISDLFYYSRIGHSEEAFHDTDLNQVLDDVCHTLPVLESEHVHIEVPRPLPTIVCNAVRVGELYRNLITNAVKYNESEKKILEIGWREADTGDDGELVFYVKDNGIGIPEEMYEQVFRIFKRLHTQSRYGGGTGSGLTFVKKIVEFHHGRIWIESELGKGTTIYFTLAGADT